jgi:hypothetical protein
MLQSFVQSVFVDAYKIAFRCCYCAGLLRVIT